MQLTEANLLLEPGYLPLETGYVRLEDGQLHVTVCTSMQGCTSEMIDWWFGFIRTTEQYRWWHPTDHIWCDWEGGPVGEYIGGTHLVHEYIGGQLQKLRINFVDPATYLDVSRFADAGVGTAVCARVGLLEAPVLTGHLIHLVRDTDFGCEMRSRFWLGDFDPAEVADTPENRRAVLPDAAAAGLLRHCHEEMSYLAGFLPKLFASESAS